MTEFQWLQSLLFIACYAQGKIKATNEELLSALEKVNSYRPKNLDNFDLINILHEIKKERDQNVEINKTLAKLDKQGYI